jgi:SAM-dependent methyltransferase
LLGVPQEAITDRRRRHDHAVSEYVLDHHLDGEGRRLALMSRLLDPMHRRHIRELGIAPGNRALEVGCGNGSISAWLAEQVAPGGSVVGLDLDLSLITARAADLEFRQGDILAGPVDPGSFDLVTARAILHHLADAELAIANLIAGLAPGGAILLIEPDFLPVSVAEPPPVREFWDGWLAWSRGQGIDYHVGRTLAPRLAALGLRQIEGTAETAVYNGGSPWAEYWTDTVTELRAPLVGSGHLDEGLIDTFLAHCADPAWWTETISFTAVRALSDP